MRDYVSKIAKDLKPSGIRKFFDLCAGSPDIISLGVGEPDFVTPWQEHIFVPVQSAVHPYKFP